MGNYDFIINSYTGVPLDTAGRLTRSFLQRHGAGLEDLLRRFPALQGATFRAAIEKCLVPGASTGELRNALDAACETLLSLREEDFRPLPVDAGGRTDVDAGLRWYAARFRDLAKAAQRM